MRISTRLAAAVALLFVSAGASAQTTVVVLRGGTRIEVKAPPVRKGATLLLTRTDGTVLSVPVSELDAAATAAARSAPPPAAPAATAPAATLTDAARAARDVPRARVRITDADVSHPEAAAETSPAAAEATSAPKPDAASAGPGRVEVASYTQNRSEGGIFVQGTLRNPGATPTINVRMSVTALDPKGQVVGSGEAGVSSGVIEPSSTAAFSVTIPVGGRPVGSFRFSPRWVSPSLPAAPSGNVNR